MKIVFVHFGREHLGLEYLSSVLKNAGHKVALVNDPAFFSREDNVFFSPWLENVFRKKDIIKEIASLKPDLVGFSPYTTTFPWAAQIAQEVKKSLHVPIVFGGIHTSLVPEQVIGNEFIDFVIVGEGEQSLLELVKNLQDHALLEKIQNLWFKKDGRIIRNPLRSLLNNLDALPLPDKELFAKHVRFKDDYMIMTSRGCLFNCSYCCEGYLNKIYHGAYFRRRSVVNVIDELKVMKSRYNFKEVMFFDSILFTDKEWLKDLCKQYKQAINVPFRCTGHVNFFDEEIGRWLKDAGCYCIDFGIQTFNQQIRKDVLNRLETNEQIKKVFNICDDLKLKYDVDLMFGLPGVQVEDYLLVIDFMKQFKFINRLKCYYLSYFPNAPIIEKAKEFGLLNNQDVENINQGEIGDWFHVDSIKSSEHRKWKKIFTKIYKIYPLIPAFIKDKMAQGKNYKTMRFIPDFLVVLLQLCVGIKHGDYRFRIYINNYLSILKKK